MGGLRAPRHAVGRGPVPVAKHLPPGPQRHAPQRARGSARAVRPGIARQRQHRSRARARGHGSIGRGHGGGRSARHALPVIAVARLRVDPAQLLLGIGQRAGEMADQHRHAARGILRIGAARRDLGRGLGFGIRRLLGDGTRDGALAKGGRVGGRAPVSLELVVQPGQGQRTARHVQAGDEFAHLGVDRGQPGIGQHPRQMVPQDEQFLVFRAAQAVQDHGHAPVMARRAFGQQRVQQCARQVGGRHHGAGADARLSVNAQAHGDLAGIDREQRIGPARQGAAVEGHAKGYRGPVRLVRHRHHRVDVQPGLGRGADDLEHRHVARDTPAPGAVVGPGAGHVVGDGQDARLDPLGPQAFGGGTEVQHVARIVAEAQDHPAAPVRGLGDAVNPRGRGRGEDIPRHRRIRQPGADIAQKGRVMPRPAAHQQRHLAARARRRAQRAMGHRADAVGMGGAEAPQGGVGELVGRVENLGHVRIVLPLRICRI